MGAAALAGGCATGGRGINGFDEDLTVFLSDLHVSGTLAKFDYTRRRLEKTVDEILAMRPLPKRVVCFGDVAVSFGRPEDYRASRPILKRLAHAGIELTLTLGNHDRRAAFLEAWPEYRTRTRVPGRVTSVVSLGNADLVLLDTLKGSDDRPYDDIGPVDGTIDPAQLAWLEKFAAEAQRPFFVGSHQFRDLFVTARIQYGGSPNVSISSAGSTGTIIRGVPMSGLPRGSTVSSCRPLPCHRRGFGVTSAMSAFGRRRMVRRPNSCRTTSTSIRRRRIRCVPVTGTSVCARTRARRWNSHLKGAKRWR